MFNLTWDRFITRLRDTAYVVICRVPEQPVRKGNKPREWTFNTIRILVLQSGAGPSGALHPAIADGDLWPPQTRTGDLRFYGMQL